MVAFNEPTGIDLVQKLTRISFSDFEGITEKQKYVREVVHGYFYAHCSIQSQIFHFLRLFVNGLYELSYFQDFNMEHIALDYETQYTSVSQSFEYYPYPFNFVFTQPSEMLDPKVVEHYVKSIKKGLLPIIFAANVKSGDAYGYCDYIIDGHSKLVAYETCDRTPPAFIRISRILPSS